MILNNDQIKLIADRGRSLPDAVLAPLVLSLVLGDAPAQPTTAPPTTSAAPDPAPRRRGRGLAGSPARRADAVVEFVTAHPGASFADIQRGLGCMRGVLQNAIARVLQDGRIVRTTGDRDGRECFLYSPAVHDSALGALVTQQKFDGESRQRLVRVERRRGVGQRTQPQTAKQRKIAIVEFVRANPGTQRGAIVKHIGCSVPSIQYATQLALQSGEIRSEGERRKTKYYVRGYVDGAVNGVSA
jgi:hypothetical protein